MRAEGATRRLVRSAFADAEPAAVPEDFVHRILEARRDGVSGLVNALGLVASPLLAFSLGL